MYVEHSLSGCWVGPTERKLLYWWSDHASTIERERCLYQKYILWMDWPAFAAELEVNAYEESEMIPGMYPEDLEG